MIKLKYIFKKYDDIEVFQSFDIDFEDDKTTVILGPSGSGKTTLLNIIAGLDSDFSGKILGDTSHIGYVFQENRLLKHKNVRENIEFVLNDKDEHKEKIDEVLSILEIKNKEFQNIKNLSGGQQQRVAIARAFCYPTDIILMDEPFRSLDPALKLRIIKDFNKLISIENKTIIYVTHDIKEAILLADTIHILSACPAEVVHTINIHKEKHARRIEDKDMHNIENDIYEIMAEKYKNKYRVPR